MKKLTGSHDHICRCDGTEHPATRLASLTNKATGETESQLPICEKAVRLLIEAGATMENN